MIKYGVMRSNSVFTKHHRDAWLFLIKLFFLISIFKPSAFLLGGEGYNQDVLSDNLAGINPFQLRLVSSFKENILKVV